MITSDEILDKLRKGESIDKIGNSIAAVLNLANEQYQEEKTKELREIKRQTELTAIVTEFNIWYEKYYGEAFEGSNDELAKTLIELFDGVKDLNNLFGNFDFFTDLFPVKDQKNKEEKAAIQNKIKTNVVPSDLNNFTELIKSFLSQGD